MSQPSVEVLLASEGAEGPCWPGVAGAGFDDEGVNPPPNGSGYSLENVL